MPVVSGAYWKSDCNIFDDWSAIIKFYF
jgi:hypothetical protein